MMQMTEPLVYRVDARERFTYVNAAWLDFALDNATEAVVASLTPENLVGQSLWEYVTDQTTRMLYRSVMARVRSREGVQFAFRCDSPDCRRLLQMQIALLDSGEIEFRTTPITIEPRPFVPLLDATAPRDEAWISMCSWCNRVRYLHGWYEVEVAVELGALFELARLPKVTHGICDDCYRQMQKVVSAPRTG